MYTKALHSCISNIHDLCTQRRFDLSQRCQILSVCADQLNYPCAVKKPSSCSLFGFKAHFAKKGCWGWLLVLAHLNKHTLIMQQEGRLWFTMTVHLLWHLRDHLQRGTSEAGFLPRKLSLCDIWPAFTGGASLPQGTDIFEEENDHSLKSF